MAADDGENDGDSSSDSDERRDVVANDYSHSENSVLNEEEEAQWKKQLKIFLEKNDFESMTKAVELLSKKESYIDYLRQLNTDGMISIKGEMVESQYFRKFAANYSKSIKQVLEKNFGKKLSLQLKFGDQDAKFNEKILSHISNQNYYRKNLPDLFTGVNQDRMQELAFDMSSKLKAVSLPKTMQQKIDVESKIRGE